MSDVVEVLRRMQERLEARDISTHLNTRTGCLWLRCFVVGVRFRLTDKLDNRYLSVGFLSGTEKESGQVYFEYVFRHAPHSPQDDEEIVQQALDVVAKIQTLDAELRSAALKTFETECVFQK
jgi:hypothetical protein